MRYGPEHKPATRARIVRATGRRLRKDGLAALSVNRVMGDAGLTMGGFYAHFRSRRALVVEALRGLMRERREAAAELVRGLEGAAALEAFVQRYLTRAKRDAVETGCPVAPLLSELPRADRATRLAAVGELEGLVSVLATATGGRDARAQALRTLAMCFGALSLARLAVGTPLSEEVLQACGAPPGPTDRPAGRKPRR